MSLRENQHAFAKALVGAGRFPLGSAALHPLRSSPLEWLRQRSELLDSALMHRPVLVSFSRLVTWMLLLSKGIGREAALHARPMVWRGSLQCFGDRGR